MRGNNALSNHVQPLEAGFATVSIAPHPGPLQSARGKVPTPRGPIHVAFENGTTFCLELQIRGNTRAQVTLPAFPNAAVKWNGRLLTAPDFKQSFVVSGVEPGNHVFEMG
ncbi:hypothetical protein B1R32_12516 [Abditibacterium utsteinense]|uniref:Alpha-L-rhamnosidase C-terminal domain-containing protein n=1 Tax=Abditibacterium utsteinense TaxID=1960156 RepID=A0A2S8SPE4_9BACT|nr:alpha-L-rhamnosidase C-terminal domain-containing protein [Abditibacterium utsteinense]PQV62667.1 hypothetical protein B1R32_12516 [Abditibacterium utsteinense]